MFETVGIVILIVLALLILWVVIWKAWRKPPSDSLLIQQEVTNLRGELNRCLTDLRSEVNTRLADNIKAIQAAYETVGNRVGEVSRLASAVMTKLGESTAVSERIFQVGKDISTLQEILKSPKLRGGLGELFLENLLEQVLPQENYRLQYEFKSGQKVDAVLKIGNRLVPIDAKFPLDDFRRIWQSGAEDEAARKQFIQAVKKNIDDIARKYILPDEGTYDFALMYIPAENVYYEVISRNAKLNEYALQKRVMPVSPNTFYAYLQVIIFGLKGLRIESEAQRIMGLLGQIRQDLLRFRERFKGLGNHLRLAQTKYTEAEGSLERLDGKLSSVDTQAVRERSESQPLAQLPGPAGAGCGGPVQDTVASPPR